MADLLEMARQRGLFDGEQRPWDELTAYGAVDGAVSWAAQKTQYNHDAFRRFDDETAKAFAAKDFVAVLAACDEYRKTCWKPRVAK